MSIYQFRPTWLMVKRHRTTGLLYLCKTCRTNPTRYVGSGKYWSRHIKSHGKDVDTIWMKLFEDRDEIIPFATSLSYYFDVVNAKNANGKKIWANLEIENGIEGMPYGTERGVEFKEKSKINNAGRKNPSYGKFWWTDGVIEVKSRNKPEGLNWIRGRASTLKDKINITKIKNDTHPSGKKNPKYDHRIHKFINVNTKDIVETTQYEFYTTRGLCRRRIAKLVDGSVKKYQDWVIEKLDT